jgi:hypothetical protein
MNCKFQLSICINYGLWVYMVTFNNISVISWLYVLFGKRDPRAYVTFTDFGYPVYNNNNNKTNVLDSTKTIQLIGINTFYIYVICVCLRIVMSNIVVFFTCAHPKWQNSQSDDGGHSTEEEEHILYCAQSKLFFFQVIFFCHYFHS